MAGNRHTARIGVFLNSLPTFGGVYQYSATMAAAAAQGSIPASGVTVFGTVRLPDIERAARSAGSKFVFLGPARLAFELLRRPSIRSIRTAVRYGWFRLRKKPSDREIHELFLELSGRVVRDRFGIDLMIYPRVDFETFTNRVPFIVSVHDLQHRLNPQFPEVSADDLWEWREYFFRNACTNALAVFVDSEIGREDVVAAYGVDPAKITVLPFLPPDYLDGEIGEAELAEAKDALGLPSRFIFYPAQFWAHKNHKLIIRALARLKENDGSVVRAVFCGAKPANHSVYDEVMDLARRVGVHGQIHCLGYVNNRYLRALYRLADALVMPTYFGPTNIPILEAWQEDCPVITSDIRGCRNQAGDGALLVGTEDVEGMAAAIRIATSDQKRRRKLVEAGRRRLHRWNVDKFRKTVQATVDECLTRAREASPDGWRMATIDEIKAAKPVIAYPPPDRIETRFHDPGNAWPFVSVITPSFNSSRFIEEAIESVLEQNYPNFEHIVVDGGSKDGTVDILKKYPHVRWLSKKDGGQSDAMNKGFLISRGEIITYLNSDDFYMPNAFYDAVSHLDRGAGKHFVAGMCHVVKPDRSVYVPAEVPRVDFYHMMWWWNAWFPINPSAYFYFREVQDAVDGYETTDHYMMDYDFLLKASLKYDIEVVERVWGNFRWFETNKSAVRPASHTRYVVAKNYLKHLTLPQKIGYLKAYLSHRASARSKA